MQQKESSNSGKMAGQVCLTSAANWREDYSVEARELIHFLLDNKQQQRAAAVLAVKHSFFSAVCVSKKLYNLEAQ